MSLIYPTEQQYLQVKDWFSNQQEIYTWGGPNMTYPMSDESFLKLLTADHFKSFGLLNDEQQLVAFGQYYRRLDHHHLGRLAVNPKYRGQGLAKAKRGLIMFLLGIIVFISMIALAIMMSGEIMMFVNVTSILVVVPPALMLTLASSSKQSRCHAIKLLFSEGLELNSAQLHAAKQVFTTFGNMNMLMGSIGVIIGAIAMGSTINSENISHLFGSAFAVCVLTLFYALLIKALCYAAEAKIQFKIINLAS